MGQLLLASESIPKLVRIGNGEVQLPASSNAPTILRIGGKLYVLKSPISCVPATTGFGGSVSGSVSAHTHLYHWAVVQGGIVGLIATTINSPPVGFSAARFVGMFNINWASQYGGLLYDHDYTLQDIKFRVDTDVPTLRYNSPTFANATYIAEFDDVRSDTHLGYDASTGKWWVPFSKNYNGVGCSAWSGTYANNGVISTTIRYNNADTLANANMRNSASSAAFNQGCSFSSYPAVLGAYFEMRVSLASWTSVGPQGVSDQNHWGITG